jgi:chromosomal replication initiation ATPase DnaA
MYVARELLEQSFAELAVDFGRHHTTVLHAWRTVAARRESDAHFAAMVKRVMQQVGGEEES